MKGDPFFSVVMPVRDGGRVFQTCLHALAASRFRDWELIVVDDGSRDNSARIARDAGAEVITLTGEGPAAARNRGAEVARATFLFFIDADCEVGAETLALAARVLAAEPALDALFGSYDDTPASPRFVSVYKNLQHHYVHQQGAAEANTFWAGCGVVRRCAFRAVGGFDAHRYHHPSIEDIELGDRLRRAGYRIRLAPQVQVKHHKVWTFGNLVRTDVLARGIPWTELLLERGRLGNDLNIDHRGRASAAAAVVLAATPAGAVIDPRLWSLALLPAFVLLALNRDFYRFLAHRRGLGFALAAVPLHALYHLECAVAFAVGVVRHGWRRATSSRAA